MDSNRAWTLVGAVLLVALLSAPKVPGLLPENVGHVGMPRAGSSLEPRSGGVQRPPSYPVGPALAASVASPQAPEVPSTLVTVRFHTTPQHCGTITYNGSGYVNGGAITTSTGPWPVSTTPCAGWKQKYLNGTQGVSITGGTATVTGNGNISATFMGPLYNVQVVTNPANCGTVTLNGTLTGGNGATLHTQPGNNFPVTATPCTGYYTSALTASGGVSIAAKTATVTGNGTISAVFQPRSFNLTVDSTPQYCGGATVGGVSIPSGGTKLVIAGTYTYAAWGCVGYNLSGVSTSPTSTVTAQPNPFPSTGNLTVLSDGFFNLTFIAQIFTLTFLDLPGNAGTIQFAGTTYRNGTTIQVPYGTVGTINALPAPHWRPAGSDPFNLSRGIRWQIQDQSIFVNASGVVKAFFVPIYYTVTFTTPQAPCAITTVQFNTSTFPLIDSHGARVKFGVYLVTNPSCQGFTFDSYTGDANVGVSQYSGIVWVNGSGTVTVNFSPNWLVVSGIVEQWGANSPVKGANVVVFYGGNQVNFSGPTGPSGAWSVLLVYGQYTVNATAASFTSAPLETFFVNGTPTGIQGLVVWINATLGLTSTPQGIGVLATYPLVLVPVGLFVVAVGVIVAWQMQRKWSRRAPASGGPPTPPASPPGVPPRPMYGGAPVQQLPPGPYGRPPPVYGRPAAPPYGLPPGRR
ncbi:MAG: hypothetical protein KGJ23_06415 [Euryarchaeota archaeon]|nr:hypothetical protein [Euryarchaeota archaeon]MDE1836234.1 hypothetical protein [Euryarchaeota archaeon]MDE2045005.1 hypothetical protein [Thermoplasmata archaeon]